MASKSNNILYTQPFSWYLLDIEDTSRQGTPRGATVSCGSRLGSYLEVTCRVPLLEDTSVHAPRLGRGGQAASNPA